MGQGSTVVKPQHTDTQLASQSQPGYKYISALAIKIAINSFFFLSATALPFLLRLAGNQANGRRRARAGNRMCVTSDQGAASVEVGVLNL